MNIAMKHLLAIIVCLASVLGGNAAESWKDAIRADHPRLFISRDNLEEVRNYAQTVRRDDFAKLKAEVDALGDNPRFELDTTRFTIVDGRVKYNKPYTEGVQLVKMRGADEAQKCAFIYLVTGEEQYKVKAYKYLMVALEFFQWCLKNQTLVDWHSTLRQNAITAYDWIYNGLNPEERKAFAKPMLENIRDLQTAKFHRNSGDGIDTGNYGIKNLALFIGLAAYRDDIDDKLAEELLDGAYDRNLKMLAFREKISGGTGLLVAPTSGYSFGMYPYATFIFFHLIKSATGKDVSSDYLQMLDYPNWFNWASIPDNGRFLQYGVGDTMHLRNELDTGEMYAHLAQSIHFYGKKYPGRMAPIYATMQLLPEKDRRFSRWYPLLGFLLTNFDPAKVEAVDPAILNKGEKAAYFRPFGLLIMRDGVEADKTHAIFRFGAQYSSHSHYDENAFVIFRKNFLALDSGSRTTNLHHVYYAPQTVAHNAILIHMPDEPMASFWAPWGSTPEDFKTVYYNHGGQYKNAGGKALALESNEFFTYAAGDAAPTYRPEKAKAVIRQFVYIYPDYFVIYDRVESVKPEQKKEFLLHFQNQPARQPDGSFLAENEGRLFVKTLLPADPAVNLVGGSGREFEASGKNWELPGPDWRSRYRITGNWRLEAADKENRTRSTFLHLLQTGDEKMAAMVPAKLLTDEKTDGLEFTDAKGIVWQLKFNRDDDVGGTVKAVDSNGKELINREFTQK